MKTLRLRGLVLVMAASLPAAAFASPTVNTLGGDTFGLTGTNLLDERIRNAVSFKKDEVLMPGRTVRLFTTVRF